MLLRSAVKDRKIAIAVVLLILLFGILAYSDYQSRHSRIGNSCTVDAKLCPDGSSVGRTGPDCEFAACPTGEGKSSYGFGNSQVGKAIADYLASQGAFAWQPRQESSHIFCVVENLDPKRELFPLYVWARCGKFAKENGALKELSSVSLPVKIGYPNELSYYDPASFTHEAPGDGAAYEEGVRQIFPPELQEKILGYDASMLSAELAAQSPAWFETEVENDEDWQAIKQAIAECRVESIMQAHSLKVSAYLKDGAELKAVEPEIDEIMKISIAAQAKCGKIIMATE